MSKRVLTLAAVLLVLLLGFAAVLATRLDSETLGRLVLDRINASGAVTIEAERFSLNPFRGLRLEAAAARGELPSGRFTATVEALELEHEFWSLLSGDLVVRQIVLETPRVEMISLAEDSGEGQGAGGGPRQDLSSAGAETVESSEGGLRLAISEIHVSDCDLVGRTEGSEVADFEIHGCELDLTDLSYDPTGESPVAGAAAIGTIRAETVTLSGIEGRDAEGSFQLADGHATLSDLSVTSDNGRLLIEELAMDLTESPAPYTLRLSGNLNLNDLVEHRGDGGFGPGDLRFEGEGLSSVEGSLRGAGTVRLSEGDVPPAPLSERIEKILQKPLLSSVPYEATDIRFRIADDRVDVEEFELQLPGIKVGGSGFLDLAGALGMRIQIRAPRAMITLAEIPPDLLDRIQDEEGKILVPLSIGGTFDVPQVTLDRKALEQEAIRRGKNLLKDEVERQGKKLLQKLIGG